jgi:monoamine oxidase
LPLGVLQAPAGSQGSLEFVPELPLVNRDALAKLAMGKVVRVTLRFRQRFWEKIQPAADRDSKTLSDLSFLFSRDPYFPTWWTTMPDKLPIITGWAPAESAQRMSGMSPSAVIEAALDALGRLLKVRKSELAGELEASYFHDWQSDPYSRGAYSYAEVGGAEAPRLLSTPVEDTLFFAGEATDVSGHNGTVHGAIASGGRAAAQIIASRR